MARRLVSTLRKLERGRLAEYDAAWERLRVEVGSTGHAWRYRAASGALEFIEFIEFLEFGEGEDPGGQAGVAECLRTLEAIAPGKVDTWVDATLSEDVADHDTRS